MRELFGERESEREVVQSTDEIIAEIERRRRGIQRNFRCSV
jgi:hypothetical protein